MGPLWLLIVLLKWLQKRLNHILANRAKLALYTTKLTLANDSNIDCLFPSLFSGALRECSLALMPHVFGA